MSLETDLRDSNQAVQIDLISSPFIGDYFIRFQFSLGVFAALMGHCFFFVFLGFFTAE